MKNYDELTLQEANLINSLPAFDGTMKAGDLWLLDWDDENGEKFHALEVLIAIRLGHLDVANKALVRAQKLAMGRAQKTIEKMTPKCPSCGGSNFFLQQKRYERLSVTFKYGVRVCGEPETVRVERLGCPICADCDCDCDDFEDGPWFEETKNG